MAQRTRKLDRKKLAAVACTVAMISALAISGLQSPDINLAFASGVSTFSIKTDKPTYVTGDTVTISGNVGAVVQGQRLSICIIPSDVGGSCPRENSDVPIGKDGSFSYSFLTDEATMKEGEYRAIARYGNESLTTYFLFEFLTNEVTGIDRISLSSLPASDLSNRAVDEIYSDSITVFATSVQNNNKKIQPFVLVMEVRDSSGLTTYLQFQKGVLPPMEESEIGISWTPWWSGNYEIRTFAVSSFDSPEALSPITSTAVHVKDGYART
jgi:hypothetical protein